MKSSVGDGIPNASIHEWVHKSNNITPGHWRLEERRRSFLRKEFCFRVLNLAGKKWGRYS